LITDQAMPGMTGIQLAEVVRRKRPNLPILLATGYVDLPASRLANLPRLAKPYQQAQLQAEIEKLLDLAQEQLHLRCAPREHPVNLRPLDHIKD
jgi:FixJ family two-component response regulator